MGWRFVPAPGWPPAPEGFVPGPEWSPDPSWPPAPPDWRFWVDETTGEPYIPPTVAHLESSTSVLPDEMAAHRHPSLWERHRERHAAKLKAKAEHAAAEAAARKLAAWRDEQAELERLAAVARRARDGEDSAHAPLGMLHHGELALWAGTGTLLEPHRQRGHYVGGYAGTSVHVAKGVNLRVGGVRGHYEPGEETQAAVDVGRVVITTTRVVFTGDLKTREWRFDKLDGVDGDPARAAVLIHVSNRQNVSGLLLGDRGPDFSRHLGLALDIAEHGASVVAERWQAAVTDHAAKKLEIS